MKKSSKNQKPKIEIRNLRESFDGKKVLNGINLKIKKGDSLAIIGGSGSGKSVLIKCIAGLLNHDSGSIKISNEEVGNLDINARQKISGGFGVLFQGGALFDSFKVWENITFGLRKTEKDKEKLMQLAIQTLTKVGLSKNVAELMPSEISGGMQKRVSLARTIINKPEIIFFDEPTTGLDPIMSDCINKLIVNCRKNLGSTTITITHDINSVKKIATHVAMIYQGKIIWFGTTAQMKNSKNSYIKQFTNGSSEGPIKLAIRK